MRRHALLAGALAALLAAAPASAAKTCAEPGDDWERATPAEVGMDAAKLQDAVDYASSQATFATRIYRHGCLVFADRLYERNRNAWYESWSMAKSITAMVFGRAMTRGLISPDDPIGALVPEADAAHGAITVRDLLTMTGGMRWNGFRDYNIFMEDRLRDFLTVEIVKEPGTWYEYSQTGPFMVAEAVQRAVGEDFQAFAQRELMTPLGIRPGRWSWGRDGKGRTQGFFGVQMRPDDYGRLGDLMRRGGVWKGRRLLSAEFMRRAIEPSPTNGCYGWLIWLNRAKPCIGPTVSERPVRDRRQFPGLPADLYKFSGLFGQLVTVLPTQDVVIVRNGQDPGLVPAGGPSWEPTLYAKVLGAITDGEVPDSGEPPAVPGDAGQENPDAGFQYSWRETDQVGAPFSDEPVPAAGPFRQRALILRSARVNGTRVTVRALCPAAATRPCAGTARVTGAPLAASYAIRPGDTFTLRFALRRPRAAIRVVAVNADDAGGTRSVAGFTR